MSAGKKGSQYRKLALAILGSVLIALFLEVYVFNSSYFAAKREAGEEYCSLDMAQAVPNDTCTIVEDGVYIPETGGYIEFHNINRNVSNVQIELGTPSGRILGSIYLTDDASVYAYREANIFEINPELSMLSQVKEVTSNGNLRSLKISFETSSRAFQVTHIYLNTDISMHFVWLRFLGLVFVGILIYMVVERKYYRMMYDSRNFMQTVITFAVMLICILGAKFIYDNLYNYNEQYGNMIEYPLEKNEVAKEAGDYGPYVQQFDAFMKGQRYNDVEVPQELQELDNPYDISERNAKATPYWWDASYYNGHYYFYFGMGPVFLAFYPMYFLTGKIPGDGLSLLYFSILAIISIFAALPQIVKAFRIKANYLLLLLTETAIIFSALIYTMQRTTFFYHISSLCTLACIGFFLFAAFKAYNMERKGIRQLWFVLAGVICVFIVLSRPASLILAIGCVAPLFLKVLLEKGRRWKAKLLDAASFLVPVFAGGLYIMWFNYVRFGDPFEFGITYQLTVRDTSYDSIKLDGVTVLSALYYYLFRPLEWMEHFPYVHIAETHINYTGNYIYDNGMFGAFVFPLNLGMLFMLGILRKKDNAFFKKATYITVVGSIFLMILANYCNAGMGVRYLSDISMIMGIFAALVILERVNGENPTAYILAVLACVLTIGIGFFLVFENSTLHLNYLPENLRWYIRIKDFFTIL